jgi:hypothetical protein
MSAKVITFVVPPAEGGVRDYADILAAKFVKLGHDARVFAWSEDNPNAIDSYIASSDCIYLQYSGYGYAKRGAPLWLLRQLRSRRSSIKKLGIFFHELYAFRPPWKSAFWLSPVQRYVASGLVKLSDFWLTNQERSARWIAYRAPEKLNMIFPVFSNVGEASDYVRERRRRAVVFGSPQKRAETWSAIEGVIFEWARLRNLELHDIGPPLENRRLNQLLDRAGVVRHGKLPLHEVSQMFSSSLYGVVAYPAEKLAKSGIFAAYCAHGLAAIVVSDRYEICDGLAPGMHYLMMPAFNDDESPLLNEVGASAWAWYCGHSLDKQVVSIIGFLVK